MKRLGKVETIQDARRQLTRYIRSYHNEQMNEQQLRTIVYAFSALLAFLKAEKDMEIEKRLEAVEKELGITNDWT